MDALRHDTLTIEGNTVSIDTYKGDTSGYATVITFPSDEDPMIRTTATEDEANAAHEQALVLARNAQARYGA